MTNYSVLLKWLRKNYPAAAKELHRQVTMKMTSYAGYHSIVNVINNSETPYYALGDGPVWARATGDANDQFDKATDNRPSWEDLKKELSL